MREPRSNNSFGREAARGSERGRWRETAGVREGEEGGRE